MAIGEVGLLGELRAVVGLERRLREAARLGFARAIVPPRRPHPGAACRIDGLEIVDRRDRSLTPSKLALAERAAPHGEAVPAMLG